MNYMKIDGCECCNGLDIGVSLFVSGCYKHCPGCFNREAWDFQSGMLWDAAAEKKLLQKLEPEYIKRFSVLGGEPLALNNIQIVSKIVSEVREKKPDMPIWVWTGYTWEELLEKYRHFNTNDSAAFWNLYRNINYLVDGPFIQEQKDLTLKFRGSKNQRILDIKAMRDGHTPIIAYI